MVLNTILYQPLTGRLQKDHGLRQVVIFGAGASKGLGVPLARELLREIVVWSKSSTTADYLAHLFKFLEEFYPGFDPTGDSFPLVEGVLGMLDTAEQYNEIRGKSPGYKWRSGEVNTIKNHFLKLIGLYLWSFQNTFLKLEKIII
jgi:hypothetical protein